MVGKKVHNGKFAFPSREKYLATHRDTERVEPHLIAGIDDPCTAQIKKGSKKGQTLQKHAAEKRQHIEIKRHNIFQSQDRNLHENYPDKNLKVDLPSSSSHRRRMQITSGTLNNLVIPFKFSDHTSRSLPSQSDLNTLMNNQGTSSLCPTGSVRDVYLENSFNQLNLDSTVVPWITIDYTESYCAGGNSGLTDRFLPASWSWPSD